MNNNTRKTMVLTFIGFVLAMILAMTLGAARTVTVHNTAEFNSWIAGQQANDLVLFAGDVGTLAAPVTGTVTASNVTFDVAPGSKPNVLMFLVVKGSSFTGKHVVTDFRGAGPGNGVVYQLLAPNGILDNVYIHLGNVDSWPGPTPAACSGNCKGREGVLSSADAGPGVKLLNCEIFTGHHGAYMQVATADAPKIVDGNVIGYDRGCKSNCTDYAIHGYTEGAQVQGLKVLRNIVYNADVLVGGNTGGTASDNVADQNFLYKADLQMSYGNPALRATATGNTLIYGSLVADSLHVGGITITGNRLLGGGSVANMTLRPTDGTKQADGSWKAVPFAATDKIDANQYMLSGTGCRTVDWLPSPAGSNCCPPGWSLTQRRSKLQSVGCVGCDNNSIGVNAPTAPIVQLYPFGTNQAHIAVVSYGVTTPHAVNVDLSPAMATGTSVSVEWAEDNPNTATPVWQGAYSGGTIPLQVSGEFQSFRVRPSTSTPTSPTNTPTQTSTSVPTVTASVTPSMTPTSTPTWTPTPTATATPTFTASSTPTPTPTPTFTPSPTPTMTDLEQQDRIRALEHVVYPTP